MRMNEHTAFSSFPTKDRGVLTANTFTPLSVHGAQVQVHIRGFGAHVHLRLEHVNETSKNQQVIASHPLPLGWQLLHCSVKYEDDMVQTHYEQTAVRVTSEGAGVIGTDVKLDHTAWTVASQQVPWVIRTGTSVLTDAVYHVPLPRRCREGHFVFCLPEEIIPAVRRPHQAGLEYNMLFQTQAKRQLRSGLSLRFDCELLTPIRGTVTLYSGESDSLDCQIEHWGDTRFSLEYSTNQMPATRKSYRIVCDVLETEEPVRLFTSTDSDPSREPAHRHAITVNLAPQLRAVRGLQGNTEMIFVMDLHNTDTVRAVAQSLLAALRRQQYTALINLVFPTDDVKDVSLFPHGSRVLSLTEVEDACNAMRVWPPQQASTGYSRLPRVLQALFSRTGLPGCGNTPSGFVRNVIIVTDEGTCQQAVPLVQTAARLQHTTRVSGVALSWAPTVDAPFLQLLASETGGVFKSVDCPDALPVALEGIVHECMLPTIANLRIQFDHPDVRLTEDAMLPVMPLGTQRVLYAIAPEHVTSISVTVTGTVGKIVMEHTASCKIALPTPFTPSDERACYMASIPHLTSAAARIRYLAESAEQAALSERDVKEMVTLSRIFSLPSPYTHLVQQHIVQDTDVPSSLSAPLPPVRVATHYIKASSMFAIALAALRSEVKMQKACNWVSAGTRCSDDKGAVCTSDSGSLYEMLRDIVVNALP